MLAGALSCLWGCSKQNEPISDLETEALIETQVANLSGVAERIGEYMQLSDHVVATRNGNLEDEAALLLSDFVYETEVCLSCIGFTNDDLSDIKEECGDYALTAIGLWILQQENQGVSEQTRSSVTNCLLVAVGADAFASVGNSLGTTWKKVTKKMVKVALKQAVKYFLGPVGALVAVSEFALCMATAD